MPVGGELGPYHSQIVALTSELQRTQSELRDKQRESEGMASMLGKTKDGLGQLLSQRDDAQGLVQQLRDQLHEKDAQVVPVTETNKRFSRTPGSSRMTLY